jgi:hypothetical protein
MFKNVFGQYLTRTTATAAMMATMTTTYDNNLLGYLYKIIEI